MSAGKTANKIAETYDTYKQRFENLKASFVGGKNSTEIQKQSALSELQITKINEAFKAVDDARLHGNFDGAKAGLDGIRDSLDNLAQATQAPVSGFNSLLNSIKQYAKMSIGLSSPLMAIGKIKQTYQAVLQNVTAVDSAMVTLRKVTDASDAAFNKFLDNASNRSIQLGASISDLINTTSIFSRAGYNLNEASTLGETATIFCKRR